MLGFPGFGFRGWGFGFRATISVRREIWGGRDLLSTLESRCCKRVYIGFRAVRAITL